MKDKKLSLTAGCDALLKTLFILCSCNYIVIPDDILFE